MTHNSHYRTLPSPSPHPPRNLLREADIVCTHEFGGSQLADVSLNGQLRDHDPIRLLENEARKKVDRYRDGYANRK